MIGFRHTRLQIRTGTSAIRTGTGMIKRLCDLNLDYFLRSLREI